MPSRRKVLLSAYACRPKGGSEPGAGWAWAKAAARDHDVWLLTRGKFAHEIAEELAIRPLPSLTVVPLELPRWLLRLRRRHADVYWYYPLWQRLAGRTARRLDAEHSFDVIHHLTFAVDWMPAGVVQQSSAKVIWGPVGGSTAVPLSMAHWLGSSGLMGEAHQRAAPTSFRSGSSWRPLRTSGPLRPARPARQVKRSVAPSSGRSNSIRSPVR